MYLHDFYFVEYLSEKEFLMALDTILGKVRKSKGFTQAQLAYYNGIDLSRISRNERGIINTSVGNVNAISKALRVDIRNYFTLLRIKYS